VSVCCMRACMISSLSLPPLCRSGTSPEEVCRRYRAMGARIIALRMGTQGSLSLSCPETPDPLSFHKQQLDQQLRPDAMVGRFHFVPAYPCSVIDATGAGNSYCGGFLVGYLRTRDVLHAALYGTVSASFTVRACLPALSALSRVGPRDQ